MNKLGCFADLLNGQRLAVEIALGTLNESHLHATRIFLHRLANGGKIELALGEQVDLCVVNAEITERAVAGGAGNADDLLKRIVGLAGDREHQVARTEQTEQTDGECLRAVDDLMTDESRLGTHDVSPDAVECVTSAVVIAVTAGGLEDGLGDAMLGKCRHHAGGIFVRNVVDVIELGAKRRFCLSGKGADFGRKSHDV